MVSTFVITEGRFLKGYPSGSESANNRDLGQSPKVELMLMVNGESFSLSMGAGVDVVL